MRDACRARCSFGAVTVEQLSLRGLLPQVQESVASCLPPLVPAVKEDAGGMIQRLMQQLLESDKYAERKGAAYGLAGLVKGLGILSLKQQEMMAALTDAIQDKKNFRRREGGFSGPSADSTGSGCACTHARTHIRREREGVCGPSQPCPW